MININLLSQQWQLIMQSSTGEVVAQLLGLAIEISQVQFPAILLSHSDFM